MENEFSSAKSLALFDRIGFIKIKEVVFLAIRGQTLTNFVHFEKKGL